jgi:hypothetical protein
MKMKKERIGNLYPCGCAAYLESHYRKNGSYYVASILIVCPIHSKKRGFASLDKN